MYKIFLACMLAFFSLPALAFNITIDPGAYTGTYNPGGTGVTSGVQTVNLPQGTHILNIAPSLDFFFDVDASGLVTSQNTNAATGSGSILSFNTTTIQIDPGAYTGTYSMRGVNTTAAAGIRSFTVLFGLDDYLVDITNSVNFRVDVDASGNVISQNVDAATGSGSTLSFNTTTIQIDPGDYIGTYSMRGVNTTAAAGVRSFILLPGLNSYLIDISNGVNFRVNVDASSNVSSQNTSAATGSGSTLFFNTVEVEVDPGTYAGTYKVVGVDNTLASGIRTFKVLPNINSYILEIGPGMNDRFNVADPCAVSPGVLNINGETFTLSCNIAPNFLCEKKTDYDQNLSCVGKFVANNQTELDAYLQDFGASTGNYQNLRIKFDLNGTDITIHSPCNIKLQSESMIQADNLCIDGREGVNIRSQSTINATDVFILSENGNAEINDEATVTATNLFMEGSLQTRIRPNSVVNLSGDLTLNSIGSDPSKSRAVIRPYAQVTAANISLSSSVISVIRHDSVVNTGHLNINGSGEVRIGNNVNVGADQITMVGGDRFSVGKNATVNVVGNFEGSGTPCEIKSSAQITAGSESGTCSPF